MNNTLFNSSAGTGKTFRLTDVYIKLITEINIDPNKIILMTFSKNTAFELKSEVLKKLSNLNNNLIDKTELLQKIESAQICTMDSFCSDILRRNSVDAGVNLNFKLFEEENMENVLDEICHQKMIYFLKENTNFSLFCEQMNLDISSQSSESTVPGKAKNLIKKAQVLGITFDNSHDYILPPKDIQLKDIESNLHNWDINEKSSSIQKEIKAHLANAIAKSENLDDFVKLAIEKPINKKSGFGKCMFKLVQQAIYKTNYPYIIAFTKYVSSCFQEFTFYKEINSLLTYDDIKFHAVEILEKNLHKIEFEYIIVDEVQDSSVIQHRLINSLWKNNSKLITCGDEKQSIYGWRDADPKIMRSLKNKILKLNGNIKPLQESWRSKRDIIHTINKIFESVYINYQEEKLISNEKINANIKESHAVELLFPDEGSKTKSEEIRAEMTAIAKRISLLVNPKNKKDQPAFRYNEEQKKFQNVSDNNKYQYSDILILLRNRKKLSILQTELKKENIPYIFHGKGQGLFSSIPARDISLLLNVICDPLDYSSRIGFLRSPWVNNSDEKIVDCLLDKKIGNPLEHFKSVYEEIENSRNDLSKKLISEVIREWIDKKNYDIILSSMPNADLQIANLKKLIDWVRENERSVLISPGFISRKLKNYINNPPKVNEAIPLHINQNFVNIMTIHTSKGLTEKIVFIPEFGKLPRNKEGTTFLEQKDNQTLIHLNINLTNKYSITSSNYDDANEIRKNLRVKEDINLFYVAMTRARDFIILSTNKNNDKSQHWMKYINALLLDNEIKTIYFSELFKEKSKVSKKNKVSFSSERISHEIKSIKKVSNENNFTRITTTSLSSSLKKINNNISNTSSINNGNLGHAILEIAAQNKWEINVELNVKRLLKTYKVNQNDAHNLIKLINKTIILMKHETVLSDSLISEFPFLFKKENKLIDGVIDLISFNKKTINIYDYKFSNDSIANIKLKYSNQIKIYHDALIASNIQFDQINCFLISISNNGIEKIKVPI